METLDTRYSFVLNNYFSPVCLDFTSDDFFVKSENYDFANKPPYATCSSNSRLQGIKEQRKTQAYPCPAVHNFSACPFYRSGLQVLKTSSFGDKNIELIKMTIFNQQISAFVNKYVICSYQTNTIYMDYDSNLSQEINEKIFDDFVREAANNHSFTIDKVEPSMDDTKPKKVSYFSKLLSNLIPA